MYNPLNLVDKHILVTGASSGIGRAIAIVLSRLGARVVLCGRRLEALEASRQATDNPGEHRIETMDLREIDAIPGWIRRVVGETSTPLNGLVHCAGVGPYTPIRTLTKKSIDDTLLVNLYAGMQLVRAVSAKGVGADGTSMVMISSMSSLIGFPALAAYSASKGALNSFVKSAAVELAGKRMRVNCVAPGWVDTDMLESAQGGFPRQVEDQMKRQFMGVVAPEEVAVLVAYLLSDAARCVTGTTMVIDGGYTL